MPLNRVNRKQTSIIFDKQLYVLSLRNIYSG